MTTKYVLVNTVISINVNKDCIYSNEIKRIDDIKFQMPNEPGVYYITSIIHHPLTITYKFIVYLSMINVYVNNLGDIIGYIFNDNFYQANGNLGYISPFNQYKIYDIHHMGNNIYPIYEDDQFIGNIIMPKFYNLTIIYDDHCLISYRIENEYHSISRDNISSKIFYTKILNRHGKYNFYIDDKNVIYYSYHNRYFHLNGVLIDNINKIRFLFRINLKLV